MDYKGAVTVFQSTPPLRIETARITNIIWLLIISIRTTLAGGDPIQVPHTLYISLRFNPHHPRGMETVSRHSRTDLGYISIHTTLAGRDPV